MYIKMYRYKEHKQKRVLCDMFCIFAYVFISVFVYFEVMCGYVD